MVRHLRTLLAVILAMALIAAACGNDDDDVVVDDVPDTDLPDLSGERIRVAALWSGDEQRNFEQVLDAFTDQTGAEVSFQSTGDDIAAVLGTSIEGGDPPDVAILPQPGLLSDFARADNLIDIEDIAGDLVDANYAPVWRDLGSYEGTLYGVWFKAANKSTVWYNVNVFDDVGIDPPDTWDEFVERARTIADFGITPISVAGADGWTLTDWFENIYLRTAGDDLYDQLTVHEIPWTHESVIEALEVLAEIFGDDSLMVGGASGALATDFPTSVTQVFTDPPEGAIVYEGDFVAGVIADETTAVLGVDADFFDFPAIGGSPPAVVGGGDVAVLMRDTPAGRALIQFLASPEAAEIWAGIGGFTSPNQNVDLAVYPDEITQRSAQSLAEAETFRFDLSDLQPAEFGSTVGAGMWGILQDFLRTPDDIEGIAQALEDAAARAFG